MRTGKSVSNIAYHRPEVWAATVNALRQSGVIGPCLWIAHKAEGNEKKNHIHFVLIGGFKTYNTEGLSKIFGMDIFPDGEKGSVTSLWKTTKSLNDWLLYGIHEPKYLIYKGETKQHTYNWSDLHASSGDEDTLHQLIVEAQDSLEGQGDRTMQRLLALARMGKTWQEVVVGGYIPLGLLAQASRAWDYVLRQVDAERKAREGK